MLDTKFWSDNYISELDPSEKLLFLYFITNPFTNICGIYEITLRQIALDTGFDKDMILRILDRFSRDKKIYFVDGWICVKNFTRHQTMTKFIKIGIEKALELVPGKVMASIKEKDSCTPHQLQSNPPASELSESNLNLNLNLNLNSNSIISEPSSQKTSEEIIKEKTDKFLEVTNPVIEEFASLSDNPKHINEKGKEFILYWTEPNKSKTKIKWELQETWDAKRRFNTWLKNDFGSKNNQSNPKKTWIC